MGGQAPELSPDKLIENLIRYAESRKWHLKYAKFNRFIHQSLLSHSLNVAGLSDRIYVIAKHNLDTSARIRLLIASFFHDIAKETTVYQNAVNDWMNGKRDTEPSDWEQMNPDIIKNGIKQFFAFVDKSINDKELDSIIWIITHMAAPESVAHMQTRLSLPPFGNERVLSEIGRISDRIMSMRSIDEAEEIRIDKAILKDLKFNYHKVGIVRGMLTQYLHSAVQRVFEKDGWIPVAWFPDGTLYASVEKSVGNIAIVEVPKFIQEELRTLFADDLAERMGESSFGKLTGSPVKSPEFLFFSEKSVRAFWQRIMKMNFARLQLTVEDVEKAKEDNSMTGKLQVYNLFLHEGEDEENARTYTSITFSISQILGVLNFARNSIINAAKEAGKSFSVQKQLREKLDGIISKTITTYLECSESKELPSIANTSTAESRVSLFKDFSNTKLFQSLDAWKKRFNEAVIESTILLMKEWKREIDDPVKEISSALANDLVQPINIEQIIEKSEKIQQRYLEGKNRKGTSICEECGNIAEVRAKSPPFEASETYHDHLTGGDKYGGTNAINVCKLCRFERAVRALFVDNGKVIILYPQLALSPSQHFYWDKIIKQFAIDKIGSEIPPITHINHWAGLVLKEKVSTVSSRIGIIDIENQNVLVKRISSALRRAFDGDISAALSYLEDDIEFNDFNEMALAILEGKSELTEEGQKILNESLYSGNLIYKSPNFILVILPDVSRNDEPPSATSLRWIFLSCLLAKLFLASVKILESSSTIVNSSTNNGFVEVQRYPTLHSIYTKIGVKGNWVSISELDNTLKRLAGLSLADSLLMNKNNPSYGRDQLIKVSLSSPGEILNRKLQDSGLLSRSLITYLKAWNGGSRFGSEL